MSGSRIPLITLDDDIEADALVAAYQAAGCFNISTAGLDESVTGNLLQYMQEFFGLPEDHPSKQAAHRRNNRGASGWTPMLEEPAYEPGTIAWVESFDCGLPAQAIKQLPPGTHQDIRRSIWPPLPGFRESVRAQWDDLVATALAIFPLVSQMLKQETGFLAERASSQALNTLRLLNYPPRPVHPDNATTGISAHTDFECITLIHQTAPGLEVKTPDGDWIQVPCAPGQWTVLFGDMIERWSNGRFRATPHRVPVTSWPRQSIVMFMAADAGLAISPLQAFVDTANPAGFQPVTQEEMIRAAMARAEANRQAMLAETEKLRAQISREQS